ncbi:hypothetical protein EK21DRAFT_107936 [Setomelanomma holmii]|uniref:Uncharacterized protein n=1 Tax=Setomelanomma holmii TaxID=210430 RepID=A0A9P4HJE1_9PLEO|nr:hypothetical protein EK21DRAFT_107936 [Setomelanomma holmii]
MIDTEPIEGDSICNTSMVWLLYTAMCALLWYMTSQKNYATAAMVEMSANKTANNLYLDSAQLNMTATVGLSSFTREEAHRLFLATENALLLIEKAVLTSSELMRYLLRDQVIMAVLVMLVIILSELMIKYRSVAKSATAAVAAHRQRKVRLDLP